MSNAERQARNAQIPWDKLCHLQSAIQTSDAEKRKQEEYIESLENELAQVKKKLEEQVLHCHWLTAIRDKSCEQFEISMKQIEVIRQHLQEEREHAQKHTKKLVEKVKAAESRAAAAEERLRDLERKIKLTNVKVPIWTNSMGRPALECAICLTNEKNLAFGCGHMTCTDCGSKVSKCPICREHIICTIKLFPG